MTDKCENHDKVMSRTFTEVNDIKVKMENIDTKMDAVIEFKNLVHNVIFGNGNPGIKGKVEIIHSQLNKQWGLIGIILTAIITGVIVHYWRS